MEIIVLSGERHTISYINYFMHVFNELIELVLRRIILYVREYFLKTNIELEGLLKCTGRGMPFSFMADSGKYNRLIHLLSDKYFVS